MFDAKDELEFQAAVRTSHGLLARRLEAEHARGRREGLREAAGFAAGHLSSGSWHADARAIVAKLEALAEKAEPPVPVICLWREDGGDEAAWDTSCGNAFILNEGTPGENEMAHCCYCGKPLQAVPYGAEEDAEEPPVGDRGQLG